MQVELAEGLELETDPEILERIVQNMISNVLKHGRKAASISLKKEGDHCIFTVKNIVQQPIQYLDKLTNRFYSENLSSSEESSGLGALHHPAVSRNPRRGLDNESRGRLV